MKIGVAIFSLFILVGCAAQQMQGYVGQHINRVIVDFGPPSGVFQLGEGEKAYQWQKNKSSSLTFGNTGNISTTHTRGKTCIRTFYVNNDDIVTGFESPKFGCLERL